MITSPTALPRGCCDRKALKTQKERPREGIGEDLLGLKHRESRSGQLAEVAYHYHRQEGTTYIGEETEVMCVPVARGHRL